MPVPAHAVAAELRARRPGLGKLALHKLLYFCQGHHLATFGRPLFGETISAWDHGPVVSEFWYAEDRGVEPLALPELGEAELNTIGYVLSRYGALTGRDLEHLTHSEEPWQRADAGRKPGGTARIEQSWIRQYVATGQADQDDGPVFDQAQIEEWLRDADARRDLDGPDDDPAAIAEQIQELRERAGR